MTFNKEETDDVELLARVVLMLIEEFDSGAKTDPALIDAKAKANNILNKINGFSGRA